MRGGKAAKIKGSHNELKSKKWLERQGYEITKSGGSFGKYDLIGKRPKNWICCQVKTNYCPPKIYEEIKNDTVPPFTIKSIHIWHDRETEPEEWIC